MFTDVVSIYHWQKKKIPIINDHMKPMKILWFWKFAMEKLFSSNNTDV